jgi:hypothetical protein
MESMDHLARWEFYLYPHPFSKGVVIKDIPVDLLKVFGIDFDPGQNLIQ